MPKKYICPLSKEELEDLYLAQGKTMKELCKILGVANCLTVSKVLRSYGIDTNHNQRVRNKTMQGMSDEEFSAYLQDLYFKQNQSINAIARKLKINQAAVRKYFKKYEIKMYSRKEANAIFNAKERNPNWNGGRHMHNGYIELHMPEHPKANKRQSVYEHRIVMEKHIGRLLKDGEVVHHINGDKTDNRIENLKLMTNSEHVKFHELLKKGVGGNG